MENYTQYCIHIEEQTGYQKCNLTQEPCVASNYPRDPEHFYTEVACRCPSRSKGLVKKVEEDNDFGIPADYFDDHIIR